MEEFEPRTLLTAGILVAGVPGGHDESAGFALFYVSLDYTSQQTITVRYDTVNGTATQANDFHAASGTLTFLPGQVGKTVSIAIIDDLFQEPDENFELELSGPTGGAFFIEPYEIAPDVFDYTRARATTLITDADTLPNTNQPEIKVTHSILSNVADGSTVYFGNVLPGNTLDVAFTIENEGSATLTLNPIAPVLQPIPVVSLAPGASTTFTIRFAPTSAGPHNSVVSFGTNDSDENPFNFGVTGDSTPPPTNYIKIHDVAVNEEQTQYPSVAYFTVGLTYAVPVGQIVTVEYETFDQTAMSALQCHDYDAASGTLTFHSGEQHKYIIITIIDDALAELDETFRVELSNPSGATIDDGLGVGTIFGDPHNLNDGPYENGIQMLVTAPDAGSEIRVVVQDASEFGTTLEFQFEAYPGFLGGVRVATGDITGDGVLDIITGAGPGGGPHLRVWNGINGAPVTLWGQFDQGIFPYDLSFNGGMFVASADINGDGRADIVVAQGSGGTSNVRVISGVDLLGPMLYGFNAHGGFTGGTYPAVGDLNGDGKAEIATGAGAGGSPHVQVFNVAASVQEISSFFPYATNFAGGVRPAIGDVQGNGQNAIITAPGPGGGAHIRSADLYGNALCHFFAYGPQAMNQGVFVAGEPAETISGSILEYQDWTNETWHVVPEGEEVWDTEVLRWTTDAVNATVPISHVSWYVKPWDSRNDLSVPWTQFATATGEAPAYGNPGMGIWAIRSEVAFVNGAVAYQKQPRRQTIATIVDVAWEGIMLDDNETNLSNDNPDDMGAGWKFVPGRNTMDPQAPAHRHVKLKVSVLPRETNIRAYVRIVDADDPTDANGPIDNDVGINNADNFGGVGGLVGGGTTIVTNTIDGEFGIAYRDYLAPLNPGDNVRIIVAPRQLGVARFKPLYSATEIETLGRTYWDDNSNSRRNDGEPILDENNDINGVHSSPLLTIWRRLHVEVDSMGAPVGQHTFGPDDPVPGDIKDPDISALAPAFRPAFIEIVELEDEQISSGALPFTPNFESLLHANNSFHAARQSIEDSMFWSVYVAGVYEFVADHNRDNDAPPSGADNGPMSGLLGFTGFDRRDYSLVSYEILRDLAGQWNWNQATKDYVEQLVVLHEIGHQFRLAHASQFPSSVMSVPTFDADEEKIPEMDDAFSEVEILKLRKDGLHLGQ